MRRGEDPAGKGLRASTTVTSELLGATPSTNVASGSDGDPISAIVMAGSLVFPGESLVGACPGTPLVELSPGKRVPTPVPIGFLVRGFCSGPDLESSIVPIQQWPEYR